MSSGAQHAQASKVLAPVAALGMLALCQGVVGLILSPDLDQTTITASEWYMVRRLGPLAGLWIAYFWPYAVLIKHRSALSHWPVLGTVGRLAYLLWGPVWVIIRKGLTVPPWALALGMFCGLAVSDAAHYVMDFRPRRRAQRGAR